MVVLSDASSFFPYGHIPTGLLSGAHALRLDDFQA